MCGVLLFATATLVSTRLAHVTLRARPVAVRRADIYAGDDEVSLGGLFRKSSPDQAGGVVPDPTCPVILQYDLDRLTVPGQSQQLHLYDTSNLSALRSAMNAHSTFIHVALDPSSTARRQFGWVAVGTECMIVGLVPSSKTNIRGEASSSIMVDVIGLRQRLVLECTQFEPHVRARVAPAGSASPVALSDKAAEGLDELSTECAVLREALGFEATRVDIEAMRAELVKACGEAESDKHAWACARAMGAMRAFPPERRLRALQITHTDDLIEFVLAELREERQRLLAMKALKQL
jgi:hypothetical protein